MCCDDCNCDWCCDPIENGAVLGCTVISLVLGFMLVIPGIALIGALRPDHPDAIAGPIVLSAGLFLIIVGCLCGNSARLCGCCKVGCKGLLDLCYTCICCACLESDDNLEHVREEYITESTAYLSRLPGSQPMTQNEELYNESHNNRAIEPSVSVTDETQPDAGASGNNGDIENERPVYQIQWRDGQPNVVQIEANGVNPAAYDPPSYDEVW